jgi:pimeloyl-ACP methyl ester carboxylesterase
MNLHVIPTRVHGVLDYLASGTSLAFPRLLALIPDCGHMPHVECPDRFLRALDGFLLKRVHR